jgi:RNA 2',3'-cyclic 3'-phosphodiesterase
MRLFVAVVPPREAVAELDAAVGPLRGRELRWTGTEQWHLTLVFLGEVGEETLPELEERLGRAARRHPAHALRFAGAGRFGNRVLWAGVRGDTRTLGRLAESAQAAARRCGIAVEERPYRAHLTLARAANGTRPDLRPYVEALAGFEGEEWQAGELCLMRSRLGGGPARYERLQEWQLRS